MVRAAQADKEKTKKISSPQPSPKERECSNGKVRQKMNEQKTVRVAQEDKQLTKKRRTMNEQKTMRAARADKEKTKKRRCKSYGQIKKRRRKEGASRTGR